jgi:hypothetical protein
MAENGGWSTETIVRAPDVVPGITGYATIAWAVETMKLEPDYPQSLHA